MALLRIRSTSREGVRVPTDDRFLDVGRLVVHMAAETHSTELLVCNEGGSYLLPRLMDGLFCAWPAGRQPKGSKPVYTAASNNLRPVVHVERDSPADTSVVYLFGYEGNTVEDFLDGQGYPKYQYERRLLVSPDTYRCFGVGSIDAMGTVALREILVSFESLSDNLLYALERGVRAEV